MAESGRWKHTWLRLSNCAAVLGGLGGLALSWFEDGADHFYRNGLWRLGLEALREEIHRSLIWAIGVVAVAWLASRVAGRGASRLHQSVSQASPSVALSHRLRIRLVNGLSPVVDRILVPAGAICAAAIIAIEFATAWGFSKPAADAPPDAISPSWPRLSPSFVWNYLRIHISLGWAMSTVVLLGLAGVVRQN